MSKRYSNYTKDDLMRILESLTPGGSEFHNEPDNCVEYVRDRITTLQNMVKKSVINKKAEDENEN